MAIKYLDSKRIRGSSTAGLSSDSLGSTGNPTNNGATLDTSTTVPSGLGTNCLNFDGSNDYLDCSSIMPSGNAMTTTGTISFWFRPDAISGDYLWSIGDTNGNTGRIYFEQQASNKWVVTCNDSSGSLWKVDSTVETFVAGTWYHIVVTHDGGSSYGAVKLYINGVDRTTNSNNGTNWNNWMFNGSDNMWFGGHSYHNNTSYGKADGKYKDIAIWNTALPFGTDEDTAGSVKWLYNTGTGRTADTIPSGLRAYYKCDSATVVNWTGSDEKATLINSSNESFTASSTGQTWTQTGSSIAISGTTITATSALDNASNPTERVTAPLGITLSDDDWVIDFEFSYTGSANNMFPLLVSNTADKILANSMDWISLGGASTTTMKIAVANAGSGNSGSYSSGSITTSSGTTYYCRMIRSDDDFTLQMYSTEALRTAAGTPDTGTVTQSTPTGITGLAYIQSSGRGDGGGGSNSWVVDNVKIYNGVAVAGVISSAYSNLPENTLFEETDTQSTWWLQSSKWKGANQPLAISDIWAWWKAESKYMTLDGAIVDVWNPQTNLTARRMVENGAGKGPTFEAAGRNGRGIAKFDGGDAMTGYDNSLNVTQPLSFVLVMKFPTGSAKTIFDFGNGSGTGRIVMRSTSTVGQFELINGATRTSATVSALDGSTWGYMVLTLSSDSCKWRINGGNEVTVAVTDDFGPISLGADYQPGNYSIIDVMHFIIYDKALSDSEITDIEEWCADEVGT